MATYRLTTRIGPCIQCGRATIQACEGCERFVCAACVGVHNQQGR